MPYLQQAKLITLKDSNNHLSALKDVVSNPKNLQFIEVEGPQTARAIDDVDLAFGYPHYLRLAKQQTLIVRFYWMTIPINVMPFCL